MPKTTHRYVAFLRGVSPMNAKMPELKRAFTKAGFTDVVTVLASGNVVFSTTTRPVADLEQRAEKAMEQALGRTFYTIVRSVDDLTALLERDPYKRFKLPADATRVVTFLRTPPTTDVRLPVEREDARILALDRCEVFSAYVPGPQGPVFMELIQENFGKNVTTRTWDTVRKCAKA